MREKRKWDPIAVSPLQESPRPSVWCSLEMRLRASEFESHLLAPIKQASIRLWRRFKKYRFAGKARLWGVDGRLLRRPLGAGALAVLASRPAAGATLAFLELLLCPANAAPPGRLLLGILDPADEFVTSQGRDVLPCVECRCVGDQCLT